MIQRGQAAEVKVLDFGIAAPRGTAVAMAGTLEYMAPEVLWGQAPTESADLYAVGVMLHQILTGRYPHEPVGATVPPAATVTFAANPEPAEAPPTGPVAAQLARRAATAPGAGLQGPARFFTTACLPAPAAGKNLAQAASGSAAPWPAAMRK